MHAIIVERKALFPFDIPGSQVVETREFIARPDLVKARGWLQPGDVAAALAFTKPLPGSTGVQVVPFLGWRMAGWPGAILATVAFVLPAFVIMTLAAAAVFALPDAPWVRGALTGLQVAVVGILASACWRLVRSEAPSALFRALVLAGFAAGFLVNAAVVVVAAGVLGVALDRIKPRA